MLSRMYNSHFIANGPVDAKALLRTLSNCWKSLKFIHLYGVERQKQRMKCLMLNNNAKRLIMGNLAAKPHNRGTFND